MSKDKKLTFSQIHNGYIFGSDFNELKENNGTIVFKHQNQASGGIAVIYAPNGTGKSSLAKVLGSQGSSGECGFIAKDDAGNEITPESGVFHIVADQIQRHIIQGDESQYLVGKEIRREYELKKRIGDGFNRVFKDLLPSTYKKNYGLSKVKDPLLKQLERIDSQAYKYVYSIVNRNQKGDDIDRTEFIEYIKELGNRPNIESIDDGEKQFIIQDYSGSCIIERLLSVDVSSIKKNAEIKTIEQNSDAIGILRKYHSLKSCIVCDNDDFDGDSLLRKKEDARKSIYDSLDKKTKDLLENAVMDSSIKDNDPFDIKRVVIDFIENGDPTNFEKLREQLHNRITNICHEMILALIDCFSDTTMLADFDELAKIRESDPVLDSDDLLFIQEVISENIDRDIKVVREEDNERNFVLMLGDSPLLNVDRDDMHLSTGEQNFISLAFELLLAKNGNKEYVVLDDPISSFDSIYKNKIAFCIIKFLENKKQIVLTHNIDLIRLLHVQMKDSYYLYILNNTDGGNNGFIRIEDKEKNLLISLSDLVKLFQAKGGDLLSAIKDKRHFLMAMIPFIRGYAHICQDPDDYYGALSNIMHGYNDSKINVAGIYDYFFGDVFGEAEEISTEDILAVDCNCLDFFDSNMYPLLAETLRQSLIYYYLRMKVEKTLVEVFNISIKDDDIVLLNQIIMKAFSCSDENDPEFEYKRACRVFFASRKTLLNEFNHFEGNMNIFQPAIDISPVKLMKEVDDIELKLSEIKERYGE